MEAMRSFAPEARQFKLSLSAHKKAPGERCSGGLRVERSVLTVEDVVANLNNLARLFVNQQCVGAIADPHQTFRRCKQAVGDEVAQPKVTRIVCGRKAFTVVPATIRIAVWLAIGANPITPRRVHVSLEAREIQIAAVVVAPIALVGVVDAAISTIVVVAPVVAVAIVDPVISAIVVVAPIVVVGIDPAISAIVVVAPVVAVAIVDPAISAIVVVPPIGVVGGDVVLCAGLLNPAPIIVLSRVAVATVLIGLIDLILLLHGNWFRCGRRRVLLLVAPFAVAITLIALIVMILLDVGIAAVSAIVVRRERVCARKAQPNGERRRADPR